jgi:mono/diheme cytochrome c family protein
MRVLLVLFLIVLSVQTARAESAVDRGRYIVEVIAACGNCHSPNAPGDLDPSRHLAGGFKIVLPGIAAVTPNITPDPETGIGSWTDEEIIRAIREGVRPDGRVLGPPMPFELYRNISDQDARAIVAYLRTVTPVRNDTPTSRYEFPLPPAWGPPVGSVPEPDRNDPVAYGAYLAGPLGHCVECHSTPDANGVPDMENHLGAGGMLLEGPWGVTASTNITPTGIGGKSDDELRKIITTGIRADGSALKLPMPVSYYKNLEEADLDAIIAYLRTLPPR